jgi:hypothetical protein
MDEKQLHSALQKFLLCREEGKDFLGMDMDMDKDKDKDEKRDCYYCEESYVPGAVTSGGCSLHPGPYVLKVPRRHMGLVVGRGGATVDRIQRVSGAKVDAQTHQDGTQEEGVKLRGGPQAVRKAEGMILDVVKWAARVEEGRWRCCGGMGAAVKGRTTNPQHVQDSYYQDTEKLVATLDLEREGRVFALDCQTVVTARGHELANVVLLDWSGSVCYQQLVKPPLPIGDYRTKYSGLAADMLEDVTTTMEEVRADLLKLVSIKDVIVCHSHTRARAQPLQVEPTGTDSIFLQPTVGTLPTPCSPLPRMVISTRGLSFA